MLAARGDGAVAPHDDETLDELLRGRIRLLQPRKGARVSLDSLLLADFALACAGGEGLGRVLDVGCGGGVVAMALAAADPEATFVGLELQGPLAELARRNARLNGCGSRCAVVHGDLRARRGLPLEPGGFDVVVSNPPFSAEGRARRPPAESRALARLEISCTIDDVVAAARRYLTSRGRFVLVFPAERTPELLGALVAGRLTPRTLRAVHTVEGEPARRVLVEAAPAHRGGLAILTPLVIHEADRRTNTAEARRILGG